MSKKKTKKKTMTSVEYAKYCDDIASDFVLEYSDILDDSGLYYDSAEAIIDNDTDGVLEYITKTLGVGKDYAKERLADDLYGAVMRAQR